MDADTLTWRKPSHSGGNGGECVELASASGVVTVRDSKDPGGPRLHIAPGTFRALITALKR